jgi:hypothetical protein
MNIYANPGAKVTFSHPNNGYEHHQATAAKHLTVGSTYTVENTEVGDSSSVVFLKEIPGVAFNTVLFEDVEGQEGTFSEQGDTKITRVGNSYAYANNVPASKVADTTLTEKDKQVVEHPNIGLDTYYIGNTEGWRPKVGEIIYFPYNYRNGRREYGNHLRTTPIIKIEGDLYYTKNSVYKIEAFNENQSS